MNYFVLRILIISLRSFKENPVKQFIFNLKILVELFNMCVT